MTLQPALLLLRRRITTGLGVRFALWAKFDVTDEELSLVRKYRATEGFITIEATRRDMWRGFLLGFPASVVIAFLIPVVLHILDLAPRASNEGYWDSFVRLPLAGKVIMFLCLWAIVGWVIFAPGDWWRKAILGLFAAGVLYMSSPLILDLMEGNPSSQGSGSALMTFMTLPAWELAVSFFCLWAVCAFLIFEQLRLAIRISDMLNGREFKHRSLVLMARRERAVIGYGYAFINLLEKMKNWEGTEVIQIGEEHEGALRLVTDVYAPY